MDFFNIFSLMVGVFGVIGTIYFGLRSRKLSAKIRRFDWNDIESGIKYLKQIIFKEFNPEIILSSPAGAVGIVVNLFMTNTDKYIPVYIGISKKINGSFTCDPFYKNHFSTNRWQTFLPDDIFRYKDKRILILEDVVLTGDTLTKMIELLIDNGFKREKISTAALFVTDFCITANRAPDHFWFRLSDTHFYLPWGRSVGKGY